jgi:hypothetical protein
LLAGSVRRRPGNLLGRGLRARCSVFVPTAGGSLAVTSAAAFPAGAASAFWFLAGLMLAGLGPRLLLTDLPLIGDQARDDRVPGRALQGEQRRRVKPSSLRHGAGRRAGGLARLRRGLTGVVDCRLEVFQFWRGQPPAHAAVAAFRRRLVGRQLAFS